MMPGDHETANQAGQPKTERGDMHPIFPYLFVLGLAGLIGLSLLAYLWLLRDEILTILRQAAS